MAAVLAFIIWLVFSVGHALTMPGGGTVSERLAEWARDHYLGPVVTFGEWLTYPPPKVGGKPSFALTGPSAGAGPGAAARARRTGGLSRRPPPLQAVRGPPAARRGPVAGARHGRRPARHLRHLPAREQRLHVLRGRHRLDEPEPGAVRAAAGCRRPGPGHWKAQPYIAPGTRLGLLATFNGGFKIATSGGGFYLNGATGGTLTKGVASVVYYRDGQIAIGVWGGTVRMTPDVVGVRQNLHLIVAHGKIPAIGGLQRREQPGAPPSAAATTCGGPASASPATGGSIFVYGPALNVRELAELLKRAGAVTAMELDINPDWMSYMYYLPKHHPADPTPVNLLPDQIQPPDRYYAPGQPRLHGCVRTVTTPPGRGRRAGRGSAALARSPRRLRWLAAVVQTARPRQWPKNLLVFAAPLAGASLGRDDGLGYALVAAAAFIAASAAVYFVNDVVDADRDRRHPVKRLRAVASGRLPRAHALALAVLGAAGLAEAVCLWIGEPRWPCWSASTSPSRCCTRAALKHLPVVELAVRGQRLRAARARRRDRHPRAAVRLVPAGVQPGRADGGDRQALHRAGRARPAARPGTGR